MASVKVPAENQPLFIAALPSDARVETIRMFGGVAAKVNGYVFAGLFGRSTMVLLPEADRAAALKLEGAAFFDPMGDGRARSEKVMLPETVMHDPAALRRWLARAFEAAARLPPKAVPATKPAPKAGGTRKKTAAKVAKTPVQAGVKNKPLVSKKQTVANKRSSH